MNSLSNGPAGGHLSFDSYRDRRIFCVWFPPISAALIIYCTWTETFLP